MASVLDWKVQQHGGPQAPGRFNGDGAAVQGRGGDHLGDVGS